MNINKQSKFKPKYIFLTGGVVSSVGKGLTTASIGKLLKERGFRVAVQKLDPYINVDPGTMSPYQHGEVFVLDDGAETDLDLGHYERFIDIRLTRECNATTGQVYAEVIRRERKGDYLGGTIQVIQHITDEIKRRILLVAESTLAEIILVEVGGTVGDIESLPFIEALRQLKSELGRENTFYVHVTWLPFIGATDELKTKPTQHSVSELRSHGISPNMIIARSDYPIGADLCQKISAFCDVEERAVIPMVTAPVIYDVPLKLEEKKVAEYLLNYFSLVPRSKPDWHGWKKLISSVQNPEHSVKIAIVGKYVELHDAYMSVHEALKHAAIKNKASLEILWIHSAELEKSESLNVLKPAHGVIVPGGFGIRGIEGKIKAIQYARENNIPFLGLCLGMQLMVVEFGRFILNDKNVNSTEFNPRTSHPVIDLMPEQFQIINKGGTMRLGLYPCKLKPNSLAAKAYHAKIIQERHRHRFEFNNDYRQIMEKHGMLFSGESPDGNLVEIAENTSHPFMIGTQFHPEFLSRPDHPHPLFDAFIKKAIIQSKKEVSGDSG
jgi:CTP synthase